MTTPKPTLEIIELTGAAYVRYTHNKIDETKSILSDHEDIIVNVDRDKDGNLVGVEILGS